MKRAFVVALFAGGLAATLLVACQPGTSTTTATTTTAGGVDRTVLPLAEPEGAPNVLVVLVDDLGFAGTSTFGGLSRGGRIAGHAGLRPAREVAVLIRESVRCFA